MSRTEPKLTDFVFDTAAGPVGVVAIDRGPEGWDILAMARGRERVHMAEMTREDQDKVCAELAKRRASHG